MISKEEFIKYIEKLTSKDSGKIKMLSKGYLFLFIFLLFFGLFLINISFELGVVVIVLGLIMLVKRRKNNRIFRDKYRKKVIDYLLQNNEHYFSENGWALSWEFEHSQISKSFDLCSSSDCLIINIPNGDGSESKVDLKICDLYAYNINRDKNGDISHSKVYKGMFGCVEFPRKFKCALCIDVNYKKRGLKLENVELEDLNFMKHFKVKSNNQIEARCILTPEMMEKIFFLEKKFEKLKIVFIDKYLYIGAPGVDLFELSGFDGGEVYLAFENLYDEIETILKMVEEIKNNNKVFKTERVSRSKK